MKKIIVSLFAFLTSFLVVCSFLSISQNQASNYGSALMCISDPAIPQRFYTLRPVKNENTQRTVEKLTDILEETGSSAGVYEHFSTEIRDSIFRSYLYAPDSVNLNQIYLTENKELRLSDLKDGYLSNRQSDDKASAHLDFLNRSYQDPQAHLIEIRSMESEDFINHIREQNAVYLYVSSNDHAQLKDLLEKEGFTILEDYESSSQFQRSNNEMEPFVPYILFLGVGACACMVLNETKKIRILAIQGLGPMQIFYELFFKFFILLALVCLTCAFGTTLLLAGSYRPATCVFFQESLLQTGRVLLLIIGCVTLIYLYILLFVRSLRDDQKKTNRISGLMLAVQVLCLVGIIPYVDYNFWNLIKDQEDLAVLESDRNWFLSYGALGATEENESTIDLGKIMEETNVLYMMGNTPISEYSFPDSYMIDLEHQIPESYLTVNLNWVLETGFDQYFLDNSELDKGMDYLLVPDLSEDRIEWVTQVFPGVTQIRYSPGQVIEELNFTRETLLFEDPAILVQSHWLPSDAMSSFSGLGSYYLKLGSPEYSRIQELLNEQGLSDLWIERQSSYFNHVNALKEDIGKELMQLLIAFLILLLLLYSVTRIYLVENEKFSFVKTISGESIGQAAGRFILLIGASYPLALIWLSMIHQVRRYTWIWVAFLFVLQVLLFVVLYRRWQKKELPLLLREE